MIYFQYRKQLLRQYLYTFQRYFQSMVEKIQFFPIDVTYKLINNKAVIYIFGRTIDGKQICVTDDSFLPYLYVIPRKGFELREKIEKLRAGEGEDASEVVKTETVNKKYLGKEVEAIKVFTRLPRDVPVIRDIIKNWEMVESINEYDILFIRRYLIDKNIIPLTLCQAEGDFVTQKSKVPVLKASSVEHFSDDTLTKPRILAFDIETYNPLGKSVMPEKNPIIMAAFYGDGFQKVITWKRFKTDLGYIEFVESEAKLIERIKGVIEEYKPDILTGYFSDGFDFPYIRTRASRYKIKLDLGLDYSELQIGKNETAKLKGIAHLDVLKFIKRIVRVDLDTESFGLNAVAAELLNEKKLDVDLDKLAGVWDEGKEKIGEYCRYNLHDAVLTYKLCEKMLPSIIEFVKIVGLPVYDINRMGFSQLVEWYLLRQAPNYNEIAPNKPNYNEIGKRKMQTYRGAFVYEPEPGLYKDITVFDFRSLYPTIISSHNISPAMLNCECCKGKEVTPTEEKYWFCTKKKGFIPAMIEELITRRMRIKEMMKEEKNVFLEARANSLKLLANSFYGYLGFYAARWYSIECAKSVTAYGRFYIQKVIDKAKAEGFKVLYSDSITNNRHVTLMDKQGFVQIKNIEELFVENADKKYEAGEKEFINLEGYKALSVDLNTKKVSWKGLRKVIRHKNAKRVFRINQKYGECQVTEDHSIICSDGKRFIPSKPKDMGGKHLTKIVRIPPLMKIKEIDVYRLLKNYSYKVKYKGRIKIANAHADKNWVWFGMTNRKKPVRVKRTIKAGSKEFIALIRLLGLYIAEGSSSTPETTKSRLGASISSGNVELLKQLQKDYSTLFDNAKASVIASQKSKRELAYVNTKGDKKTITYKDSTHKLQMMNILSAVFFKVFCGQKSRGKKLPYFIYHVDKKYQQIMLACLIEGDGSKSVNKRLGYSEEYIKNYFKYTTNSLELASGFSFLLTQLGQKHTINYRASKEAYSICTSSKFNKNFKTKIIEEDYRGFVYDLEVEDTHVFVDSCGQVLLHNTDSIFLSLKGKSKKDAEHFSEAINVELPGLMELEYEGFYPSGIFVSAKVGPFGAKKKYALISEDGLIKIKGFETVRRNWSLIAKEVQEKVLNIILKENNKEKAFEYVKGVISDLRDKKVPVEKVVIATQLQKEISSYDAVGPHVAIAQKLKNKGIVVGPGSMISYVVTQGKERIRDRAKLPDEVNEDEYDADYYINNQVVPAVEKIFEIIGYSKGDLVQSKHQKKLDRFFN